RRRGCRAAGPSGRRPSSAVRRRRALAARRARGERRERDGRGVSAWASLGSAPARAAATAPPRRVERRQYRRETSLRQAQTLELVVKRSSAHPEQARRDGAVVVAALEGLADRARLGRVDVGVEALRGRRVRLRRWWRRRRVDGAIA